MEITRLPKKINSEELVTIHYNLAVNIRLARFKTGLSQEEMAKRLGYDSGTAVSLLETGHRKISAITLWKISSITGEPVSDLLSTPTTERP
jgi:transcriptional regulator with XRE-family HTH domain